MDFLGPVLSYLGTIPAIGAWLQASISLAVALAVLAAIWELGKHKLGF